MTAAWLVLGVLVVAPFFGRPAMGGEPESAGGADASADRPMLWAIQGKDGKHSFIFGTCGSRDVRVLMLPDVVQRAFASADLYVSEVPYEAGFKTQVAAAAARTDGKTLKASLGDGNFEKAQEYLQPRGINLEALNGFRTLYVAQALMYADDLLEMSTVKSAAERLWERASEQGKSTAALETIAGIQQILDHLTEAEQVSVFTATLGYCLKADFEKSSATQRISDAYAAGDAELVRSLHYDLGEPSNPAVQKIAKRSLEFRNAYLADRIDDTLKENPGKACFFAMDVCQLAGDQNVIKLLEAKGRKLKRLSSKDAAKIKAPGQSGGSVAAATDVKYSPAGELGCEAPALDIGKWVKGKAVNLKEGRGKHVYVVEFWATWCGPCRQTIPHLTKLQKKYDGKVTFVGVTNEPPDKVEPFVDRMGETMGYTVAIDAGGTGDRYMTAFGANGIPHAFVIDRKGAIVFQGHPMMGLEEAIEKALADS